MHFSESIKFCQLLNAEDFLKPRPIPSRFPLLPTFPHLECSFLLIIDFLQPSLSIVRTKPGFEVVRHLDFLLPQDKRRNIF
jgi:hypothetical protein